ncbi:MAG TPA: [protein-PII] uridylyltransferase [Rhodobiaceae bacterium]|nr:[protein-PII] uridylyltransferase [Rhodobiaceae bacterium]
MTAKKKIRKLSRRETFLADMRAAAAAHRGHDAQMRAAVLDVLKDILHTGRNEAREKLEANRLKGARCAEFLSDLQDDIMRALSDFVTRDMLRLSNPTDAETVTVLAVGGYGRGRLAPGSDIDLLFLLPYKRNATSESFVEHILYFLWDLGLKVGHATRTVKDCMSQAQADYTVRTTMLENRFLSGAPALHEEFIAAFQKQVMRGTARQFVEAKLTERDERHIRAGQSRYLVEPNIKESKGGLRDLNTLFWIARYCYQIDALEELIELKILTADELRLFRKCDAFLWEVRCHLHFLTGRAEERLSFDVQKNLAERFNTAGSAGMKSVEKFMRRYFLVAKNVGDLTAIFCASLEEQQKKPRARARLPALFQRQKQVHGFKLGSGRLTMARADCFRADPVNLIRVFHLADRFRLDIHPDTLREITRSLALIGPDLRADRQANDLFLEILTSRRAPERTLRRMNEAGVLGRFVPDFGRIVAMMQFNMYHHYTADEHLLRAIGLLSEVEQGKVSDEHPIACDLLNAGEINRRVIYLAVLLHDIAKGRPEDHSIAGARIARRLGPRLGFTEAETRLTEWLVREHLVMSDVAQRRDLSDPRTIQDFANTVQTNERLKHLLVLTEVDIKAVGPGVWNGWKAKLISELYFETQALLVGSGDIVNRAERVAAAQSAFSLALPEDWTPRRLSAYMRLHSHAYWLNFPTDVQVHHAALIEKSKTQPLIIDARPDPARACAEITVICDDDAGLFARLSGACARAGMDILDARISTTTSGLAVDVLHVQEAGHAAAPDAARTQRLCKIMRAALEGSVNLAHPSRAEISEKTRRTLKTFDLETQINFDNQASEQASVIEISALDRPGLLFDLARALYQCNVSITAARVATFGERASDVFYVQDLLGEKLQSSARISRIRHALTNAIHAPMDARADASKVA